MVFTICDVLCLKLFKTIFIRTVVVYRTVICSRNIGGSETLPSPMIPDNQGHLSVQGLPPLHLKIYIIIDLYIDLLCHNDTRTMYLPSIT